ncbi:MAG: alpha/beta fold hydrolase [Deltaproteobacteria bacterium]|nr:alpha/beta fold hydrolase [Deltaproteobacteria bacterium]
MWFWNRLKRLRLKWHHLNTYFRTLSDANAIERLTDFTRCKHPVLSLYGFGATRRSVQILESRLRADGFGVFSIDLGGFMDLFNTAPIDKTALMVAAKIENLSRRHKLPRFSIIGYSKGGLIGRYYLAKLGGEERVHTLITLATPHRGSPWLLLGIPLLVGFLSKGLRQMMPQSRFMRRLAKLPFPRGVYVASIYSPADKTTPPKFCRLSEVSNGTRVVNVNLPQTRHSDFVIKQKAYLEIRKHLNEGIKFDLKMSS